MESNEYQLLLQHNDEIVIPMDQQKTVPSLKKLTAQYIAKNYTNLKTKIENSLPTDCKELVELELPLTKDNAWKIFTKNEERQQECLEYLRKQHSLVSKVVFSGKEFFTSSYNSEHDKNFFLEKIQSDLKQQNIFAPETKINALALYCANEVPEDNKKLDKMARCCNCVICSPFVICYLAYFGITFLVLVTVGTPAFPF
jgi:hypothetical protein